MPFAFSSLSHGEIAFGFFNIDVDMLLLEQYFFYADQFCESVVKLARAADLATCRGSRSPDFNSIDFKQPDRI